ncbi:MAG: LamG domain-containing protein [Candidatus Omnitrophica bacterium]|nr:LamG domain-containing protein [Candidatus Omnitrophota bacterium]
MNHIKRLIHAVVLSYIVCLAASTGIAQTPTPTRTIIYLVTPTPTSFTDGNLVGYWNFDEGLGNIAKDSSGNEIHGLLSGAQWGEGYVNGGMYFDGEDDFITLGDDPKISDLSSAYSIAFWVKFDKTKDFSGIYRRASDPVSYDANIEIFLNKVNMDGFVLVHNREGSTYGTYWPTIESAEWHHVTVTWNENNGGWRVFYDGTPQTPDRILESRANPKVGGISYIGTAIGDTGFIGGKEIIVNDHFSGYLDEFRIYDIALTPEQVLAVYENSLLPTPTLTPIITPTPTPTPENWSSFNGATLEDNLLVSGAPAGYMQGKVSLTSIPEGDGSDGVGMEIKLAPGQGAFVSSLKQFDSPSLMHLSGQIKASNKEAAIALVALNSPIDGQIGYTNLRADEIPVDDYRQFNLIYAPPFGRMQYAVQAVNNPFSTISTTVWVDNIKVKPFEPIVDGDPVALEIDGDFEGGLEKMLVNINGDDGIVIPFFESITDVAIRMSLDPSNIAANIGTICLNRADQFPFRLLGQVSVKRESLPGGGMLAMVLTNGYQNLGVFRYADSVKDVNSAVEDLLIIGGDFTVNNPDIPLSAFVQIGGPDAEVSVVVDDLIILKQ